MTAVSHMVSALFPDYLTAAEAYAWLKLQGYNKNDINLLMSDETAPRFHEIIDDDRVEDKVYVPQGSESRGILGASLAASLAVGIGLLAGGPIVAALGAGIPAAMVGGLIGGLVGYGVPQKVAVEYEQAIRRGAVLISIDINDAEKFRAIEEKFSELGGKKLEIVN
jgi:hypothetical protein